MNKLYDKLDTVTKKVALWSRYEKLIPVLVLLSAGALYAIGNSAVPYIIYGGWTVFIAIILLWSVGAIMIILDIIDMFKIILKLIGELRSEIRELNKDLNDKNK